MFFLHRGGVIVLFPCVYNDVSSLKKKNLFEVPEMVFECAVKQIHPLIFRPLVPYIHSNTVPASNNAQVIRGVRHQTHAPGEPAVLQCTF